MKKVSFFVVAVVVAGIAGGCSSYQPVAVSDSAETVACRGMSRLPQFSRHHKNKHKKKTELPDTCRTDELITVPAKPSISSVSIDPDFGYCFITGITAGSVSNLNHQIEYGWWADGINSIDSASLDTVAWGGTEQELPGAFSQDQEFFMWVKARCTTDQCVASGWSEPLHFIITNGNVEILQ